MRDHDHGEIDQIALIPGISRRSLVGLSAAAAAATALPRTAHAAALSSLGVVLVHGKGANQQLINPVANALRAEGAQVVMPRLSWAGGNYRPYDQTLAELNGPIARLRSAGRPKIVLAGQSLGANLSLAYAARFSGVAAVVAMAPGHRPANILQFLGDSLDRAKAMVAAGRGRETATFLDYNLGRAYPIKTTAEAYASFFDPDGQANMANTAPRVSAPILWVIGSEDRPAMQDSVSSRVGRRLVVPADHRMTPQAAVREVTTWLRDL
jgi:pimeloyl-ACP methyl ester carboxylesterase